MGREFFKASVVVVMMKKPNPAHATRAGAVRILISMQHKKPESALTHCQARQARLRLGAGATDGRG